MQHYTPIWYVPADSDASCVAASSPPPYVVYVPEPLGRIMTYAVVGDDVIRQYVMSIVQCVYALWTRYLMHQPESEMNKYIAMWWDATDNDIRWGHDSIAPPYAVLFRKPVGGIMCLMAIEDPSFQQYLTILARVALEAWRNYHQEMERGDG